MPIRPENRSRYPKDWKQITAAVRERAGDRCEGSPDYPDCRVEQYAIGYWEEGRWVQRGKGDKELFAHLQFEYGDWRRLTRIVLTCGHLDHTPENCDPSNLRAWCQRCHLHYDRHHHAATAYATRKKGKADADLFEASP